MTDEKERLEQLILHPLESNQDSSCPEIEWMGEDLTHVPGIGEWKCRQQPYNCGDLQYGDGSESTDYSACNNPNHKECPVYKERLKK